MASSGLHLLLRCLWKRRQVALEQTVIQAWQDLCFTPTPWMPPPSASHQSSKDQSQTPPPWKVPPPPPTGAAKYIGLWGQISSCQHLEPNNGVNPSIRKLPASLAKYEKFQLWLQWYAEKKTAALLKFSVETSHPFYSNKYEQWQYWKHCLHRVLTKKIAL